MARRFLRWLGIATLVIGYPILAHSTNQATSNHNLGALVSIAPVVVLALVLAWRLPQRVAMLGVLILVCMALWFGWSTLEHHVGLVYWLQHVGMQLILFMTFGRTLFAGRQPLCTQFAEVVHTMPLTPQHEIYARQVTIAWTLFFAAIALTSSLLFFLAPLTTWSVFANFLTLPLVALMFIAEYAARRWLLPEIQHTHIFDSVRAFRNTPARPR